MALYKNFSDTSTELRLFRYGNGIKLIQSYLASKLKNNLLAFDTGHTVSTVLQLPFNVYFNNTNSAIQKINDISASICGFDSTNHSLGKTMRDTLMAESADKIIRDDQTVLQHNKITVFEDDLILNDGNFHQGLTIKSPWYNNENKIIGFFGFTIIYGMHNVANALQQAIELGLLNPAINKKNNTNPLPIYQIDNAYFTQRENNIIKLLLTGKTAKLIAEELHLSKRTIEWYLEKIKIKMNVTTKSDLLDKLINMI